MNEINKLIFLAIFIFISFFLTKHLNFSFLINQLREFFYFFIKGFLVYLFVNLYFIILFFRRSRDSLKIGFKVAEEFDFPLNIKEDIPSEEGIDLLLEGISYMDHEEFLLIVNPSEMLLLILIFFLKENIGIKNFAINLARGKIEFFTSQDQLKTLYLSTYFSRLNPLHFFYSYLETTKYIIKTFLIAAFNYSY